MTPGESEIIAFARRWGFAPDSPALRAALTHRSAAASPAESNERLEFLGDALLSAFVARFLLDALPPDTREGVLSRARTELVRRETLARAARALGVAGLLIVGSGERKANRHENDSLLADAYEALVAAVYRERGGDATDAFLRETLADALTAVAAAPPAPDPKTDLQMRLQASGRGLPAYRIIEATGNEQSPVFTAEVLTADGTSLGTGTGASKRAAQTDAARAALANLPPEPLPERGNPG
ncbi:MAG TPA: ribonuclease III [Armatimonadaceae bacterium]|nr:ribonuclease III [Armatimonadaceae bacterium]